MFTLTQKSPFTLIKIRSKTKQSLSFFLSTDFDFFITVAPKTGILGSWQEDSNLLGIEVETLTSSKAFKKTLSNKNEFELPHGFLLTPYVIEHLKEEFDQLCQKYNVLLILDEGHHYGNDMAWKDNIQVSFNKANFKMATSGTPYRTDMNKIACLLYGLTSTPGEYEGIPEYIYTYEQSLNDRNVAPIITKLIGGSVSIQNGSINECYDFADGDYSEKFGTERADLSRKRLKLATTVSLDWQHAAVCEARKTLMNYRQDGLPWAGLIVCSTIDQANSITRHIENTYSDIVETIVDSVNTNESVKRVNENESIDWVISITKVSEGVSIKRLRVGLSLSYFTTRTFFEQSRGRLARLYNNLPSVYQSATFFIPKDPKLVEFALTANKLITDKVSWLDNTSLPDSEKKLARDLSSDLARSGSDLTLDCGDFMINGEAMLDGVIDSQGNFIDQSEVNSLRAKVSKMGLDSLHISNYGLSQLVQTIDLWDSI